MITLAVVVMTVAVVAAGSAAFLALFWLITQLPLWHQRYWNRVQTDRGSLFEELAYLDGWPAGCVCYSWRHRRWAATWNCIPDAADAEHYVFPTRASAVAALPRLYPRHGSHARGIDALRRRLAREARQQQRRAGRSAYN